MTLTAKAAGHLDASMTATALLTAINDKKGFAKLDDPDQRAPLVTLPTTPETWFGGMLPLLLPSHLGRGYVECAFFYWATEHELIFLDAQLEADLEAIEVGCIFADAMYAPRIGLPRRPTQVVVEPRIGVSTFREGLVKVANLEGFDVDTMISVRGGEELRAADLAMALLLTAREEMGE